jgi:uncharacterized cupredoxin-like copper-binding protein
MKHLPVVVRGTLFAALLLFVAACGGNTSASTQPVQITLTEFHIASSVTRFTPGVPYQFIITNKGKLAHEFMIMPKNEGDMSMMPMSQMDKLALAKVENIKPGTTVTLTYTFAQRAAGTHPQFACYYPGHYMAGMKLDVTVTS